MRYINLHLHYITLQYIFPIGLPLHVPKNWVFGVLKVKMWNYCLLTPKRHYRYPAWIRVRWYIAWQNRFNGLSSRSVERFLRTKKEIKKLSGNFGCMGRSNPWGDLDQMRLVGRYGGRNHVCDISWLSVKGCGCGERGKFAFSHWLTRRPYNTGHTTVWPCDEVAYPTHTPLHYWRISHCSNHMFPHSALQGARSEVVKVQLSASDRTEITAGGPKVTLEGPVPLDAP